MALVEQRRNETGYVSRLVIKEDLYMQNKNREKAAQFLNAVDKNDISYDKKGRLIVRSNHGLQHSRNDIYKLIATDARPKDVIKNKMIHPEDRIVRRPLSGWASELASMLREIAAVRHKQKYAAKIAEIYNNSALIFLSLGDIKSARELCYSQIQLFITSSHVLKLVDHVKFVIQPWINLSRIDRLEGDLPAAIKKLELLNLHDKAEVVLGNSRVLSDSLKKALSADEEMNQIVKTCCLFEPIKAYMYEKKYHDMRQFIEIKQTSILRSHQAYLQEAMIVALVNTGRIKDAVDVLCQALVSSHPGVMHVFKLREAEIKGVVSPTNECDDDVEPLYKLSKRLLEAKYINVNDILFALHTVHVMVLHQRQQDAAKLAYFCLQAAYSLNDELLIAESLSVLFKLAERVEVRKVIENLMIEHYFKTQYVSAKEMMLKTFADLKYVECQNDMLSMTALYEELLAFSIC
jgi:tetratricopeptide (TPR) repeat protein